MPLTVIGLRGAGEWFDVLLPVLQGDDAYSRLYAAVELGRLKEGRAVGPLLRALDDPDAFVRLFAAWALGVLRAKRAVERITALLEEPEFSTDPDYQEIIATAIAKIKNRATLSSQHTDAHIRTTKSAISPSLLVHPDRDNRDTLLQPIFQAIDVDRDEDSKHALRDEFGMNEEINTLIEITARALRHDESKIKVAAIKVLERIADDQASALLQEALQSADAYIRCCAARALARRGESYPIAPFEEWDHIKEYWEMKDAINSLIVLQDSRGIPALIHALHFQDYDCLSSNQKPSMRERVVAALIALTGEDFGYDVAMWQQWAAQRA